MTLLTHKLKRETRTRTWSRSRYRPIIVILEPPGALIGFRLKGERTTYFLPVADLFRMAVKREVERQRRERKKLKGGSR